jgi:hypothetical protein
MRMQIIGVPGWGALREEQKALAFCHFQYAIIKGPLSFRFAVLLLWRTQRECRRTRVVAHSYIIVTLLETAPINC